MIKRNNKKQKSLAEEVAETIFHSNGSDSEFDSADEATKARVIDYDEDEYELPQAVSTEFRKRNVKLLSEQNAKYKGEIISRKDFESDLSEEEDSYEKSDSSEGEQALEDIQDKNHSKENLAKEPEFDQVFESDDDNVNSKFGNEGENEESEEDDYDESELNIESEEDETEVISKVNHEAELQKALCVQNQLRIWERLLEMRINLQKLLNKTNQLPSVQELNGLQKNNNKYNDIKKLTCNQIFTLLQNLLSLKNNLFLQFSEVPKALKPSLKRLLPFAEHNSTEEPPIKKVSQHLEEGFMQFRPYRNDILLKWDDRTKLLQSNNESKKRTFNEEYDIIKKIENALINKSILIEKSQQLKTTTQNETTRENKRNPNIYDDSDFYHQQLRELIEYKSNTASNMSEVTKQFLELQKLRQKMKKKVDTRATKGRKLRYVVHNKLINFMAPHDNCSWTMESIDDLSKSLFI